jgi:hypothetical protein
MSHHPFTKFFQIFFGNKFHEGIFLFFFHSGNQNVEEQADFRIPELIPRRLFFLIFFDAFYDSEKNKNP